MNNITDSGGNKASHVKIIRAEGINYTWDGYHLNNWSIGTLQKFLNSGDYYNRTGFYESKGLTTDARERISNVVWNLGGHTTVAVKAATMYTKERGTAVYGSNPTTWTGYVGLIYPSDYGFAVGGSVRTTCLGKNLSAYDASNCYTYDWLYMGKGRLWTITTSSSDKSVIGMNSQGLMEMAEDSNNYRYVYPVVYLNTNIMKVSGSGTSTDPYIIG
ncbi:MAG: hypothetical protein K2L98_01425 [Bacilli bacterium]|nr:hypothetical protein [Bacilli bacterium]